MRVSSFFLRQGFKAVHLDRRKNLMFTVANDGAAGGKMAAKVIDGR